MVTTLTKKMVTLSLIVMALGSVSLHAELPVTGALYCMTDSSHTWAWATSGINNKGKLVSFPQWALRGDNTAGIGYPGNGKINLFMKDGHIMFASGDLWPLHPSDAAESCAKLVKICTDFFGSDYKNIGIADLTGAYPGWHDVIVNNGTSEGLVCPHPS